MDFKARLKAHAEHVQKVAHLCNSEETTKQALILPLLDILGFSAFDPSKVRAEYHADFPGVKVSERVDYALFCNGEPVMYIEAKSHHEKLTNHAPQLARYFNASPTIAICAITNGQEWRFFTDLENKNVMDETPFLTIDVREISDTEVEQLYQFRFDKFQPETLRTLAEESVYLSVFTEAIKGSLQDVDMDFVRYVATRANIQRQFNQKFLDSIRPLVKQAVERALSAMVVSGLSQKEVVTVSTEQFDNEPSNQVIIDPNNEKIITTQNELRLFDFVKSLLPVDAHIEYKDTETYFGVLFNGKVNRWVCRYYDNKRRPSIVVPVTLTDTDIQMIESCGLELSGNQIIIDTPENILRVAFLLRRAYMFCQDDKNFRREKFGNNQSDEL